MNDMRVIRSAEFVLHGVLKLTFDDGYEGLVDFRPFMAIGKVFTPLREPDVFRRYFVEVSGFSLGWGNPDDPDIDFGADRLWEIAHEQADLLLARAV